MFYQGISTWCKNNDIYMVVVGPEDPLANGIADILLEANILCFGPCKAGICTRVFLYFCKHLELLKELQSKQVRIGLKNLWSNMGYQLPDSKVLRISKKQRSLLKSTI